MFFKIYKQEERRCKIARYSAVTTASAPPALSPVQGLAMMAAVRPPHPGVVVEAPPAMVTSMAAPAPGQMVTPTMVHTMAGLAMPVSMPGMIRPAMSVVSAPIMTGGMPAMTMTMPTAVPPLQLGGMRAPLGLPQGK